jgi:hypothetical protein
MRYAPNWLLLAGAVYPLLWLNAFALFVIRARLILGRWPSPYNPDPKDLGLSIHYGCLLWGLVAIVAVGLLTFVGALVARRFSKKVPWLLVILAAATPVLTILFIRWDPGRFMEWFMD